MSKLPDKGSPTMQLGVPGIIGGTPKDPESSAASVSQALSNGEREAVGFCLLPDTERNTSGYCWSQRASLVINVVTEPPFIITHVNSSLKQLCTKWNIYQSIIHTWVIINIHLGEPIIERGSRMTLFTREITEGIQITCQISREGISQWVITLYRTKDICKGNR